MHRANTKQDKGSDAAQDDLRALVRLLARQAAQEFVTSSLTDSCGETNDQTIKPPARA